VRARMNHSRRVSNCGYYYRAGEISAIGHPACDPIVCGNKTGGDSPMSLLSMLSVLLRTRPLVFSNL
jgi:hypothetical protein